MKLFHDVVISTEDIFEGAKTLELNKAFWQNKKLKGSSYFVRVFAVHGRFSELWTDQPLTSHRCRE